MRTKQGRNHIELVINPFVGDIYNIFDILSIFSYLYENRLMKEDSFLQRFWYRIVKQRWYSISLIPMHIVKGYYYKYTTKEIYKFCKRILFN